MRFVSLVITAIALIAAPSALAEDFLVTVGASNLFAFSPTEIHPVVGDTVTFQFLTRNHSATTTTFTSPCPPPPGGVGPNAFDTGFNPTSAGVTPSVTVTIEDTEPHFVSCMQAAGAHCRMGMTLAINPTADETYAEFLANALAS